MDCNGKHGGVAWIRCFSAVHDTIALVGTGRHISILSMPSARSANLDR